ncbi:conserved Plasmodium protein, unknown function [Plasmodium knowlesi strain H]|uniref:DM2 domain-containing protein n=3 Tax=Plasmodium knowlesi TaxID=5850 RepID=A0A5K1VTG1_PLAKH|nr:SWIB/MDM2 domain-containing protein, putative [Plasmodium knowlesi strain H]OTN64757.1 Uncharacterized protein PKNOH_S130205500 [Plasmodium knowlesi]CAA9989215.1 SWIB/MDM2 domain-containing protein, putative [Plasmodium knowlesi strain H]SBO26230.1 conserved Plasmodium protein, unknown function [Plasmodium knowlesi strain H]SBO27231.1 conserved Plasmodium protein, unknown function [Plasmodium knowlesi strain H]VVS78689.1 SWIB/MDM2 domain-containing protein, putative [Plasmodium knowlesi str|eukprot:XP_002261560.1 hypothetical protein, conserved in Plasmodium species [Plasmodium knowlesi strain H]
MEPIDRLNSNCMFADSNYYEKEDVIKNLYNTVLTRTVKEVDEKNYNLIETLVKYEGEINRCIDMSNYYINEAFSSTLKTEKVRRRLRVHIYTVFNDGDKEMNYPADIEIADSENIYKYASPSSFTFNIHGYILNTDENDYDNDADSPGVNTVPASESKNDDNDLGHLVDESRTRAKDADSKCSGTDIGDLSDRNEQIDYCNTTVMKFTSFFSTIMVMRDKETIIYDKNNKNYYDCDKLTFSRIVNEKKKETIKIFLFLDQKIPFFELSPQLKNFMQSPEETMPEVIKRIYEYSLEKELIDSSGIMRTDEVLRNVLEVDEYEFCELPRILQKHVSIQKPIVLEHVVDLEKEEESESIYDIVVDIFEPFVAFENGKLQKFVLDSHHLNNLLQFLKMNETKDDSSDKVDKCHVKNIKSSKVGKEGDAFDEKADQREEVIQAKSSAERNRDASEEENSPGQNTEGEGKINVCEGGTEKRSDKKGSLSLKDSDKKGANFNSPTISIFEKLNGIQSEIDSIDEDIINILCKIKQKNSLRLRYTNFYENPCGFIDHMMNSKFPVDFESVNDNNYIYDQAANINDDNYYKLPWVHRGISKYLLIKNKNFDDVLKSVLNSMNLDCKRKLDDMNTNESKKQKLHPGADENFDNNPYKINMNYSYHNQPDLNNNAYFYYPNKNMNFSNAPESFINNPMQNFYNNMNYESSNMPVPVPVPMSMAMPMAVPVSPPFPIEMMAFNGNNNKLPEHMNLQNNFMHNNEQGNFNMYAQQVVPNVPYMMNYPPFNEMPPQNGFNPLYPGAIPMDGVYPNGNFYSANNYVP